jgi:hypothetical protein
MREDDKLDESFEFHAKNLKLSVRDRVRLGMQGKCVR